MEINKDKCYGYIEERGHKMMWLYDNEIMNIFASKYPQYHNNAVSWESYGISRIIVKLNNGKTLLYDDFEKRLRLIKPFKTSSELTEDEWKRCFIYFLEDAKWRAHKTQLEIAFDIGMTEVMVNRYFTGKSIPNAMKLQQIAESLKCDINDILPHDFVIIDK